MKRCPQCHRVEADDALVYCRIDGAALISDAAFTPSESETSILPHTADASADRSTGTTTALATHRLSKSKLPIILIAMAVVMGLVVIAVLVIAMRNYHYGSPPTTPAIQSIAVMPFVNESGNADNEYLSDGMTETLIGSLSQLPNLSVKARSSVFRYKGRATDAKTISKELNVQAILNGRVVQRGDQLTLSLELVDAQTENVIWSERYNRKSADLISLQTEIARDVSQKLKTC